MFTVHFFSLMATYFAFFVFPDGLKNEYYVNIVLITN